MNNSPLADDLLKGVEAIAEFICEPPRRTSYMLEQGQLPAWKTGRLWRARKSTILKTIEQRERAALEADTPPAAA